MISVLIPNKNEDEALFFAVIENLVMGFKHEELEIIIVNDGSINPDATPKPINTDNIPWTNVLVIENTEQWGVGYSFDRASEHAQGEILVLMGADVFPQRGWDVIRKLAKDDEIGCACSVGLSPSNYNINKPNLYRRYGAELLYTVGVDDLPKKSPLRKDPTYTNILEGQFRPKVSDKPYEISCLMGAFYWCKKSFYQKIHGWDTLKGQFYRGHRYWGALESMISLKTKVYGGRCMMYPFIEAGHVFGKIDDIYSVRAPRGDFKWWNRLWTAHTMLDDELRDEVLAFPKHEYALSLAKSYIAKNMDVVKAVRERNRKEGKLITKK